MQQGVCTLLARNQLVAHFKNSLHKMQRVLNPMLKYLGVENRKKGLQFYFQISVNVLHADGISVIYITLPRLFSLLEAIYNKNM